VGDVLRWAKAACKVGVAERYTGANFGGSPRGGWQEKGPSRPGVPPSRHTERQACLLLFSCTCNGDLVTKNETE
jgi:hypothetical protein